MTQEEKDLLIKDLCARLPYGVVIEHCSGIRGTLHDLFVHWCYDENDIMHNREAFTSTFFGDDACDISKFKPYLFPLSSMTEEQKTSHNFLKQSAYANPIKLIDWYIKNHFDYRGLIPLGLANDATGLNIY
jgi:hypothetical protein